MRLFRIRHFNSNPVYAPGTSNFGETGVDSRYRSVLPPFYLCNTTLLTANGVREQNSSTDAYFSISSVQMYVGTAGQDFKDINNDPKIGPMTNGGFGNWQLTVPASNIIATTVLYAIAFGPLGSNPLTIPESNPASASVTLSAALQDTLTDGSTLASETGGALGDSAAPSSLLGDPQAQPLDSPSASGILDTIKPFLDHDLPIVGSKLDEAVTFLSDLEGAIQNAESQISTYEQQLDPDGTNAGLAVATALQNELNQLGPSGSSKTDSSASLLGLTAVNVSTSYFNVSSGDFSDPNAGTPVTSGPANAVQFNLDLAGSYPVATIPIVTSFGVPGLGISISKGSALNIKVNFDLYLHFGAVDEGASGVVWYLDTNPQQGDSDNDLVTNQPLSSETTAPNLISLGLSIGLSSGSTLEGKLGPLELTATDETGSKDAYSNIARTASPTNFAASIGVDLGTGSTNGMTPLSISGLSGLTPSVSLSGMANINLDMLLTYGGDTQYPSIAAEMHLAWGFGSSSQTVSLTDNTPEQSFGNDPTFSINNVAIGVGTFLSGFARTVVDDANNILAPVKPIVNLLNTPMPIFNDFSVLKSYVNVK